MPSCQAHIHQAKANFGLQATMDPDRHPDWSATIAFYCVLHLVEACLDQRAALHSGSHSQRERLLTRAGMGQALIVDYLILRHDSMRARYQCAPELVRSTLPHTLARFDRLRTELCRLLGIPVL